MATRAWTPHLDRKAHNVGFLLGGLTAALCALSCQPALLQSHPSRGGQLTGSRSQFNQSCGAACAAPVNASTGELVAPAATRASQAVEKLIQAAETVQGLNILERALTGAELDLVEATLKACVAQAHADINEAYQQSDGGFRFENGKFPNDSECKKIVGFTEEQSINPSAEQSAIGSGGVDGGNRPSRGAELEGG